EVIRPQHVCDLKDVVTLLVKHYGLHEGIWGPWIEFGIGGINMINPATGKAAPAAVVPIIKFGIQPFEQPSSITVDAAQVNPKEKAHAEKQPPVRKTRAGSLRKSGKR